MERKQDKSKNSSKVSSDTQSFTLDCTLKIYHKSEINAIIEIFIQWIRITSTMRKKGEESKHPKGNKRQADTLSY